MHWLLLLLWIVCGIWAYLMMRAYYREKFKTWTVADRRRGLFTALLGPVGLGVAFICCSDDKKEAKW